MQAYLAKYTGDRTSEPGKTKKKKKKAVLNQPGGIRIFEENNTGFRNNGAEEVFEEEGMAYARIAKFTRAVFDFFPQILNYRAHKHVKLACSLPQ